MKKKILTAIFIVLLLSSFIIPLVNVNAASFGNNVAGGSTDNCAADTELTCTFSTTAGGNATAIVAYIADYYGPDTNVTAALRSDSTGDPDVLLGSTSEVLVTSSTKAWVSFNFSVQVELDPVTDYWVSLLSDAGMVYGYDSGGTAQARRCSDTYADGYAATFGSETWSSAQNISIYVDFNAVASPPVIYGCLNNSTRAGNTTRFFSEFVADDLDFAWVEHNETGSLANTTATAISGTYDTATVDVLLSSVSEGDILQWRWCGNTTSGLEDGSDYVNQTVTTAYASQLYTDGADVKLTSDDSVILLNGTNYGGMGSGLGYDYVYCYWQGEGDATEFASQWDTGRMEETVDAMSTWGINLMRNTFSLKSWITNSTYRDFMVNLTEYLDSKNMYLLMEPWGVTGEDSVYPDCPFPPYGSSYDAALIPSKEEWYTILQNITVTLGSYGNLVMGYYNEPAGTSYGLTASVWQNASNYATMAIRQYSDCPIVYQWDYGAYDDNTMEWVNTYEINDIFSGVIYSTHSYYFNLKGAYTESDVSAEMMQMGIYNVTQEWSKPLIIGEWGANLWFTGTDLAHELESWTHYLNNCNSWGISTCQWIWHSTAGGAYFALEYGATYIPAPSEGGKLMINNAHQHPFVWNVGTSATYIYSNDTLWSGTWSSGILNVLVYEASTVRVWWNVSDSYSLTDLQIRPSNGTIYDALTYYSSTSNLLVFGVDSDTDWVQFGYDLAGEPEPSASPTPTPSPSPSNPPVIVSNEPYYFRSDSYETNGVVAYGLDTDFTNSATYLSTSGATGATVVYGFRVYQLHSDSTTTELTSGSPVAQITMDADQEGYLNATWYCPETSWAMGLDAVEVKVYVQYNGGDWTLVSTWVTPSLLSGTLEANTWTFRLYLYYSDTGTVATRFYFGSGTYRSSISGILFADASVFDIMLMYLKIGDFVGFFLFPLNLIFGAWWYFLIILAVSGAFYLRYRNITVILVLFVLFGGAGGLAGALLPAPVDLAVWVMLALGLTGVLWRVFR